MESKREKTHAGVAFYSLVLEPMGITIGMLKGEEMITQEACDAMSRLSGTSVESWSSMRREIKTPLDITE